MKFQLEDGIQILSKTPEVLVSLLSGLSDEWIRTNEGENTWSPYDIVGHLIHGEKTDWIPRAKIILSDQENKTFIPFDRFAQLKDSQGNTLSALLDEFRRLRAQNISTLEAMELTGEKLNRKGMHPDLGEVSLTELLATWVAHDLSHINQMTRVMARNYSSEAGPWKAYISILR
jgi:uncharacterized damage-inducible protein DinB